ncbi:MAG: hypothetical protein QGG40_14340, partial [Myxococcota bacterium]|nr:hypothetical protein [Myxococcota bacterium]
ERAVRILTAVQVLVQRAPRALGPEALAADWHTGTVLELGIVGELEGPDTQLLLDQIRRRYLPFSVLACVPSGDNSARENLPWMERKVARGGKATAYLCQDRSCQVPTTEPSGLGTQLDGAIT